MVSRPANELGMARRPVLADDDDDDCGLVIGAWLLPENTIVYHHVVLQTSKT